MEDLGVEVILFGVIVIVLILDRFLNTTLENSFSDEKIMIGKPGSKKKKIKTKALVYITIIILYLFALFVPKSLNFLTINKTSFTFLELLFWISLHLLTLFYCYSLISKKINFKKILAREILFMSMLTTISIVANLYTSFLNENYEITFEKSSPEIETMSRIKIRKYHYRLAPYLPKTTTSTLNEPINIISTKEDFQHLNSVNHIYNYKVLSVNDRNYKFTDWWEYTFEHYYKVVYRWGNHPYNVFNYFWKINISKSVKDSAIGIIFYVGFIFRGILFLLFGAYQLNKWALVNLKDKE